MPVAPRRDEEFSDVNAAKLVPSDDRPSKLWIVLIVLTPLGLLTTLLLAGPYIGALLIGFLQGLQ